MSKARDRARAKAGNRHISTHEPRMVRPYVCAYCHKPGHFVKVGDYYFHESCPKEMIPFTEKELKPKS